MPQFEQTQASGDTTVYRRMIGDDGSVLEWAVEVGKNGEVNDPPEIAAQIEAIVSQPSLDDRLAAIEKAITKSSDFAAMKADLASSDVSAVDVAAVDVKPAPKK